MRAALAILTMSLAGPALASDFKLAFPVDCTLGETCHIQQFMDRDPGPGARDFTCGPLSYDGHRGTDFAVATLADMEAGVNVLAAAPGIVAGLRDGMPDIYYSDQTAAFVENRECGNGMVIDHGNGWETQYCHLKQGSVTVRRGDRVETGDVLGQIGLSGKAQFPHLHLSVRKDGQHLDPFSTGDVNACALNDDTLWQETPAYTPGGLLDLGFAQGIPDYADVKAGRAATPVTADGPAIVLFAYAFGSQAGDRMQLETRGPDGEVFNQTVDLDRTQAQFFRATGIRLRAPLTPGTYTGTATFTRNGQILDRADVSIDVN